jgi:2-methylcitrate synthase
MTEPEDGLRGVPAGRTALSTVGDEGDGLTYRGYAIEDLARDAAFEEVAYLLLRGTLPNRAELAQYREQLRDARALPEAVRGALERIPPDAHPMDVLRTGASLLGTLEPETAFSQQQAAADRLIAALPGIVAYWYRFSREGKRIETATDDDSIAAQFLHLLHDRPPAALDADVMRTSLVLYAEHEFNASTFTARVCASTRSDVASCVTAAIGALRGPLHGGANEAAMDMLAAWSSPDEAEAGVSAMLARRERVMGFGHAVYRHADPRNAIIRECSQRLARERGDTTLQPVAERVAEVMCRDKGLFPNADFFHATAYRFMGIPKPLATPVFTLARAAGWCAHVMEQRQADRIIRPSATYTGPAPRSWVPLDERD